MADNTLSNGNSKTGTIILVINVLFLTVWIIAYNINVYKVTLVGAIYEMIWLPLIICLFALPVASFIFWRKDSYNIKSKFLYLIVLAVLSITLLLTIVK